ncbi:MAG: methylthioribulose 1-phosphate dehydratase [Alicyclobacillus sp.]|nr:methylthioribulose 1-phosphate dehydratase [Alicyclobacillus sp.]
MSEQVAVAKAQVVELADRFARKGWLPATSGNLSVRVSGTTDFCVTRSGADKQRLATADVLWLDASGQPREATAYRPSAETVVHQRLYAALDCGAIVHVHTVFNNLASELWFQRGGVDLAEHELLKALGHWREGARIRVPIVENYADLDRLAEAVCSAVTDGCPAVLVRNHGIYAWGADGMAAVRHLEAFEFLFEYRCRLAQFRGEFCG